MEQLFLDVLNRAITAGWLVLVVVVLRLVLKKAPKALHYGLWLLVGVRLLWPGEELLPRSAISLVPSTETIPSDILSSTAPQISSGIPAINNAVNPALSQTLAAAEPEKTAGLAQIAAIVWLAGAVTLVLYLVVSFLLLRIRLRTAVRLEKGVWQSDWVDSPFVLGLLWPQVYLPFGLDEGSRDYVLAHERMHIRHGDHWIKPLAFLLLAVFWFNPLLWLAYVLLCRDMEYACDERVLRDLEEPGKRAYSQALLDCAAPKRAILACPVAFGETCVKGRIRKALRYKKPAFWVSVAGLAVLTTVALCFFTNPPAKTPYAWANRLTASRLGELSIQTNNSITSYHDADLKATIAQQLSALTEDDFVLLTGSGSPWQPDGSSGPFSVYIGKYRLCFGAESDYPLVLLFQDQVYGVNSDALLQTILPYTDALLLTEEEAAAIPLHIDLSGLYWGQWEADAENLYASVAGEDFIWTPRLTERRDTLEIWQEDGLDGQEQVATIFCQPYHYEDVSRYLLYVRGNNDYTLLRNAGGGCTLTLRSDSPLASSLQGLYIHTEALYQASWLSELSGVYTGELLEVGSNSYTLWNRGSRTDGSVSTEEDAARVTFPYRGAQSFTDADWATWFPDETTRPDISGYSQRWLMELGNEEHGYTYLLQLDGVLYRLSGNIWDGEVISLFRLRPVPGGLSGGDVLALDRLLEEVSNDRSLSAISYSGTIQARMRELDSYQALLDYGNEAVLAYCCTMLEYGYPGGGYVRQLVMSTACNDILAELGEDTSDYAMDAGQDWYQTLKRCAFSCDEPEKHPGYRYIRSLGLSKPVETQSIAREDMDGDGVEEAFVPSGTELCLMRPTGGVLWRWALPDEGDAALWRLQEWTATLLEYRALPDGTRLYRMFTLQNGQEQVQEEARLAPGSDSATQLAFAEGFNAQLQREFPPQLLLGRIGDVQYSNTYQTEPFLLGADYA